MVFPKCQRIAMFMLAVTGAAMSAAPAAAAGPSATAPADSAMSLAGGSDGTVFHSLTVEAENRVQIEFDRPQLQVALDPATAPGLSWGSAQDVLERTSPDLVGAFLDDSARHESPYAARPWVTACRQGPVVVIRSDLEKVDRWRLTVLDSRGEEVYVLDGRKNPPREIPWDGRLPGGEAVLPGLTCSFVLEATDKAGNKRRFVGDPFEVASYRIDGDRGAEFLVAGSEWKSASRGRTATRSPYLLETASWFNLMTGPEQPIVVQATARSISEAEALGRRAIDDLRSLLPGDASRLALTTRVEAGVPGAGVLRIRGGELNGD